MNALGRVVMLCAASVAHACASVALAQSKWSVDPIPIMDIGGVSPKGDVLIALPSGATRLPDGTIVVADRHSWSIRYFDSRGQLIRTAGRQGDGPGEFRGLSWLGRCAGDTTFVWDFIHRRMRALDTTGKVVRQFCLPLNPIDPVPYAFQCSANGVFALLAEPMLTNPPQKVHESTREKAPLFLADAKGQVIRRIGEFVTREYTIASRIGSPMPRPLGRETSIALSNERVYVGTADSAVIEVFALDGTPGRPIYVRGPARRPTRQQYEKASDQLVAYQEDAAWRARFKQLFLDMPMPATLPPYSALLADRFGALWVVRSVPGDADLQLTAYSIDGRALADVRLPRFLTVFEIGADYILGTYEDGASQPHVAVYTLRRASPSR